MGVVTTFDEKIKEAREGLAAAVSALLVCVTESTWGYDNWEASHIDELHEIIAELVKLKRKL